MPTRMTILLRGGFGAGAETARPGALNWFDLRYKPWPPGLSMALHTLPNQPDLSRIEQYSVSQANPFRDLDGRRKGVGFLGKGREFP